MQSSQCMPLGAWPAAMGRHCDFFELLRVCAAARWLCCRPATAGRQVALARTRTRARAGARILTLAWASRRCSLLRNLGVAVVVGLVLLRPPPPSLSSTTAGLTGLLLHRRLSHSPFLLVRLLRRLVPLLELNLFHPFMEMLLVGAVRPPLGVRDRGRRAACRRAVPPRRLLLLLQLRIVCGWWRTGCPTRSWRCAIVVWRRACAPRSAVWGQGQREALMQGEGL